MAEAEAVPATTMTVHVVSWREFLLKTQLPWLIHRRRQQRLTQYTLAYLLGVSRQSITFWEAGRRTPTLKNLIEWIRCLE